MAPHPSDENLRVFLEGPRSLDPLLHRRVVRHLLEGCRSCRERLAALDPAGDWWRVRPVEGEEPERREIDYDDVLARAEQTFSLFMTAGRPVEEPPGVLLAELVPTLEEPSGEPDRPAGRDFRRAIPTLVKWLIARSHAARFDDPRKMLHWGLMAHLAANSCSAAATGGPRWLADLRARAWGQFGTALRVCGRFREAGEVLASAGEYLAVGTGDLTLRAHYCEQMTSLRINQKAFGSAADLTLEAEEICEAIGERQSLVAALMQRAITFHYREDPEAVLPILDRAIALLGPDDDPDLLLVARLNRAHAYVSIDRSARALAEFRAARNTDRGYGRPALRLRTHWQEAQLLGELGHLEAAAEMLCAVRRGFLERNLAPEMVAASRDLASLYRRMGRRAELEETVLETQALFFGIPAEAEVLASLRELERMAVA